MFAAGQDELLNSAPPDPNPGPGAAAVLLARKAKVERDSAKLAERAAAEKAEAELLAVIAKAVAERDSAKLAELAEAEAATQGDKTYGPARGRFLSARACGVGDCTCLLTTLCDLGETSGPRIHRIPPTRPPWRRRQYRELKKLIFSAPRKCPIDLFGPVAK